jgi:hypothetical protein
MPAPDDATPDPLDGEYEEYIEFQCPMCQTPVSDDDRSCPGCGAIFVSSDEATSDPALDEGELEMDYDLDGDVDYDNMAGEDLDAELDAMEADLEAYADATVDVGPGIDHAAESYDADSYDLDLSYEEDLEEEEEIEEVFGTAVKVSADDHGALETMSMPTLMERLFQRTGLGMFIAGGIGTVLVILWDPIQGNPMALGMTQWRFLVLAMAMFIVGFVIEMLHAYSLAASDEDILQQGMVG